MCPPSLMCPPPHPLPVHDNTIPGGRGRPLRGAKRPITLRRRLIGGFERPEPPPVSAFPVQRAERSTPRMAKKRSEPRKMSTPTPFEQARDELFSHILRCGVLEATPE